MTTTTSRTPSAERLQLLVDRQDILDCLVRVNRGADRSDRELFLSAFHPDAIIDVGYFVGGPEQLYDYSFALGANTRCEHHYLLNQTCDVDGDAAHAESYFIYVATPPDGPSWACGGRYIDRFERHDTGWKVVCRQNNIEWSGMLGAAPLPFAEVLDLHANGAPSRNRQDPSYRRPFTNRRARQIPAELGG
jgi:hypothetical protein